MRPTKEELEHLYRREGYRQSEIAALYGVKRFLVSTWLREYGIPYRGKSLSAKLRAELSGTVCGRPIKEQPIYEDI